MTADFTPPTILPGDTVTIDGERQYKWTVKSYDYITGTAELSRTIGTRTIAKTTDKPLHRVASAVVITHVKRTYRNPDQARANFRYMAAHAVNTRAAALWDRLADAVA